MKQSHYNKILLFLCFTFFLSALGQSQEVLTGIRINHNAKKFAGRETASYPDTISLPVIEDFARHVGYPSPGLWMDKQAYVNYQYPVNPPSIGVVTLDVLDASGMVYPQGNETGFAADTLTSRPIDLDLQPADSVYLSFYYQSGGKGDTSGGEFQDSLVLEYYSPDSIRWESIWRASYSRADSLIYERNHLSDQTKQIFTDSLGHRKFFQAIVPVNQERFLKEGFQYRFRNYGSLSDPNEVPSRAGNVDHWHIDFIRLDKDRSYRDTTINDIAFVEPMNSLLVNYESVPWEHWPDANNYEMSNNLSITYRNLGDKVWNISREFEIIDRMGDNETFYFTGGTGDDIPPYTKETYPRSIDYIFPYNDRDSALFEIKSYLVTDTSSERAPYRWNDTVSYFQKFYNYYAYDDGTAENGYGIPGQGSENAMMAFRFRTYTPDSLQAIQIYFNQTLEDASRNSFKLVVWEDNNGKPGRVIYEQEGFKPVYEDSVNRFHNYVLNQKPFIGDEYFFIGYQKFNTEMLNVGFDVNNVNNDKLFFNLSGSWEPSQLEGTIMIRPVFGKYLKPIQTSAEALVSSSEPELHFTLYPNPARNRLHINLETGSYHDYTYSIFNLHGRSLISERRLKRILDVNDLSSGVYLLKLRNRTNGAQKVKKFVISR